MTILTVLRKVKTLILISTFFSLASCGGGGGGDGVSTGPGETIKLSSVVPTSRYSGLSTQAKVTREKTREIIEDILYLDDFIKYSISQVSALGANSNSYKVGEPQKTSINCENGGYQAVTVDRREDKVLIELYAKDCADYGAYVNGTMQFEIFNESDWVNLRFIDFSSQGLLIHGEYSDSVDGQLPVINLMFQEGKRSFLVEDLSMPRLQSNENIKNDYDESSPGRVYYSDEGFFLVKPGQYLFGSYPEDRKLVWSKTTIEGSQGSYSSVEVKEELREYSGYIDDSRIEVVLQESDVDSRKYYFDEYHEWLSLDFTNVNTVPPQAASLCSGCTELTKVSEPLVVSAKYSFDSNNDMLSYDWRVIYSPEGSASEVIEEDSVPEILFNADTEGYYTVGLKVFDGEYWSDEVETYIKVGEVPYLAGISAYINSQPYGALKDITDKFFEGNAIELNASNAEHYPENTVTYWKVLAQPEGELAALSHDQGDDVVYTPQMAGSHKIRMTTVASSGFKDSYDISLTVYERDKGAPRVQLSSAFKYEKQPLFPAMLTTSSYYASTPESVNWTISSAVPGSNLLGLKGTSSEINSYFDLPGKYVLSYELSNTLGTYSGKSNIFIVGRNENFELSSQSKAFELKDGASEFRTSSNHVGDFNGDGLEDIVIQMTGGSEATFYVHFQSQDGSFQEAVYGGVGKAYGAYGGWVYDIDFDGQDEFLVFNAHGELTVTGFDGNAFSKQFVDSDFSDAGFSHSISGDLNDDGLMDFVFYSPHGSDELYGLDVYIQKPSGGWTRLELSDHYNNDQWQSLTKGAPIIRQDGAGKNELVVLSRAFSGPSFSREHGDYMINRLDFSQSDSSLELVNRKVIKFSDREMIGFYSLIDIDSDGLLDLTANSDLPGEVEVYYDVESGGELKGEPIYDTATDVSFKDVDGNGFLDMLFQNLIIKQSSARNFDQAHFNQVAHYDDGRSEWIDIKLKREAANSRVRVIQEWTESNYRFDSWEFSGW